MVGEKRERIRERIKKEKTRVYSILSSLTFIVLATGMTVYHFAEGWSWIDSLYFSAIALTTVGFGDITPTTPVTKLFTIIYIFIGIGIIFAFINNIAKKESE